MNEFSSSPGLCVAVERPGACCFMFIMPLRRMLGLLPFSPCRASRHCTPPFQRRDDPAFDGCPHCYNARGSEEVKQRGIDLMAPDVLERYGGGEFPLNFVPTASNGSFLEPNEVAVRHEYCGDPEQVKLGCGRADS